MAHQVYMPAKNGPFRCDHCEYFVVPQACRQPNIVRLLGASQPRGMAKVDPGGCSDYYEPRSTKSVAERVRS